MENCDSCDVPCGFCVESRNILNQARKDLEPKCEPAPPKKNIGSGEDFFMEVELCST